MDFKVGLGGTKEGLLSKAGASEHIGHVVRVSVSGYRC